MRRPLTGLLFLILSLPAGADDINMLGAGKLSCREWQTLRSGNEYFSAGNWVLGFLSGSAWDSGQDLLAGQKPERLFVFIDNWCTPQPDRTVSDAAVALAYHLLETSAPDR